MIGQLKRASCNPWTPNKNWTQLCVCVCVCVCVHKHTYNFRSRLSEIHELSDAQLKFKHLTWNHKTWIPA